MDVCHEVVVSRLTKSKKHLRAKAHARRWLASTYSFHEECLHQLVQTKVYEEYKNSTPQTYQPLRRSDFGKIVKQQFPAVRIVRRNWNNTRVLQYVGLRRLVSNDACDLSSSKASTGSYSSSDSSPPSEESDEEYLLSQPKPCTSQPNITDSIALVKKLLPHNLASDSKWMELFIEQVKNCGRHRRWSINAILLSLDLYIRSPKAYANLSNVLKLPSKAQLIRYKNFINQRPGIVHENLHWMVLEANRRQVTKEDRCGFIVFDEMSIQPDLQMESAKPDADLIGFTDYGEAQGFHMLCRTGGKHTLATHILQFIFLGFQGFSWPVAYYCTTEAHSSELMVLVWKVINAVQQYGFKIEGMLMNSGANNLKFVKLHFPNGHDILQTNFLVQNPDHLNHHVCAMMDPSHGIKKIRNSCFASAKESRKRRLRWGQQFVLWEHWEEAYRWNEVTLTFKVYHKLTDVHIFLTDTTKMRNHLAMEVLNCEMLHLMQVFQEATGRSDLELTLRLLRHTANLVETFTSDKPIISTSDKRLTTNQEALEFFKEWYYATRNDPSSFITKECYEDLASTITSFNHIVNLRFKTNPCARIIPSVMNSDIIENFFCSQRARCNGANTNPTVLAYSKAINTLIITTDRQRSTKRNTSGHISVGGAHPYKTLANQTFRK